MICKSSSSCYLSLDHWLQGSYIDVVTRWSEGLINKDVNITNEVYSISNVEFDRQVSGMTSLQPFLEYQINVYT